MSVKQPVRQERNVEAEMTRESNKDIKGWASGFIRIIFEFCWMDFERCGNLRDIFSFVNLIFIISFRDELSRKNAEKVLVENSVFHLQLKLPDILFHSSDLLLRNENKMWDLQPSW